MTEYLARYFNEKKMADAWVLIQEDFLAATWSTLYITLVSTLFAILIGLPLGILLVTGDAILRTATRRLSRMQMPPH